VCLIGIAGVLWAITSGYAQGCAPSGQPEGRLSYPVLANSHGFTGP
jgi:hypothetical protein